MNSPGQANLNRTERTGWTEHDRKDRTAGTGQLTEDSQKRMDTRERLVIRPACTSHPEGPSKMITQKIDEKLSPVQMVTFMLSFIHSENDNTKCSRHTVLSSGHMIVSK